MNAVISRRSFLIQGGLMIGAVAMASDGVPPKPGFKISLAEWSLHRTLRANRLTHLEFPKVARREFNLEAVEYVNSFFKDKAEDERYLTELRKVCDGEGVRSLLIMCDGEGQLGDPDDSKRRQAVENHRKWVSAARQLGCHSIRVNAATSGTGGFAEQQKRAADGLHALATHASRSEIDVIVENHGGLSSNGAWLAGVIRRVNLPNCGTLPDFGNFRINAHEEYDRYRGVEELMPFARGVSAKSYDFDDEGNETTIDYRRMLKLVLDAGYHNHIGIEYEGNRLDEYEGIRATKKLLERVRSELG